MKVVYVDAGRLNLPGGDVNNWLRGLANAVERRAARTAPRGGRWSRPGRDTDHLAASHASHVIQTVGGLRAVVTNSAHYALWVHNGTADRGIGFIHPRGTKPMPITDLGVTRFAWFVHGQGGQPWMREALLVEFAPYHR